MIWWCGFYVGGFVATTGVLVIGLYIREEKPPNFWRAVSLGVCWPVALLYAMSTAIRGDK